LAEFFRRPVTQSGDLYDLLDMLYDSYGERLMVSYKRAG
jgi:hypothetical protein